MTGQPSTARRLLLLGGFACFALAAVAIAPMMGPARINPFTAFGRWLGGSSGARPADVDILIYIRLPRIGLGFMAGAALAVVGAVFQALLRNPLATPYTLGVASGGSFGALAATLAGAAWPLVAFEWGPLTHVQATPFLGAHFELGIIYLLARGGGGALSMHELLLAGVTMGLIFSALIMGARYLASPNLLKTMDLWLMGRLSDATWAGLVPVAILLLPSIAGLLLVARPLDLLALGEELAGGRGVDVARLQKTIFLLASLAIGAIVAAAGPIGFVGLIVPHTVRRIAGPAHTILLPASLLAGGGFLVLCDAVARTILAPAELPVGILTAVIGGPWFIAILLRGRKGGRGWMR